MTEKIRPHWKNTKTTAPDSQQVTQFSKQQDGTHFLCDGDEF